MKANTNVTKIFCRWSPISIYIAILKVSSTDEKNDSSMEDCYITTAVVLSSVSDKSEKVLPKNSADQEVKARQKEKKGFGSVEVHNKIEDSEKIINKSFKDESTV